MFETSRSFAPRPRRYTDTCLADVCHLSPTLEPSIWRKDLPPEYVARASRVRRKWWEWEYLVESARACEMLDGKRNAIGLAVGCEPLIFYFANHCENVLATDLYSDNTIWLESRFSGPDTVADISPIPFNSDRLEIKNMDMRKLEVPDASQDFAWSTSSIEHVPTLIDLLTVFRETARVLKPGGYAFLTTEFSLIERNYLLPGLLAMDHDLFGRLLESMTAFEPVGFQDLDYNWAHPNNAPTPRRYTPIHARPDIARRELCDFEGGGLIALMAGMTAIAPVGFTLRRRAGGEVPTIEELGLPPYVVDYCYAADFNANWSIQTDQKDALAVAERLTDWMGLGPTVLGEQFMLLMYRQYIEAMSRATSGDRKKVMLPSLEWALDLTRNCSVLDADCLDLVSHFLFEFGEFEACADLSMRLAWSPSTVHKHVVQLAVRQLKARTQTRQLEQGIEDFADLILDMVMTGVFHPRRETTYYWRENGEAVLREWMAGERLAPFRVQQVLERVKQKLTDRSGELDDLFVVEPQAEAVAGC